MDFSKIQYLFRNRRAFRNTITRYTAGCLRNDDADFRACVDKILEYQPYLHLFPSVYPGFKLDFSWLVKNLLKYKTKLSGDCIVLERYEPQKLALSVGLNAHGIPVSYSVAANEGSMILFSKEEGCIAMRKGRE